MNSDTKFKHNFFPTFDLERIDTENGRYYILPDGEQVPSVTTVLSRLDHEWLDKWKARVGEDKALRTSTQAKRRGTAIHDLCEKYLLNNPDYAKGAMPFNLVNFKKIKPYLDKNVSNIRGIEARLFSKVLKTAGTTDLICDWVYEPAIVDFKTSKYPKKEADILNYFIQMTAYSQMVEELFGLKIKKIVIIMVVDHEQPLIFERNPNEYLKDVYEAFQVPEVKWKLS